MTSELTLLVIGFYLATCAVAVFQGHKPYIIPLIVTCICFGGVGAKMIIKHNNPAAFPEEKKASALAVTEEAK